MPDSFLFAATDLIISLLTCEHDLFQAEWVVRKETGLQGLEFTARQDTACPYRSSRSYWGVRLLATPPPSYLHHNITAISVIVALFLRRNLQKKGIPPSRNNRYLFSFELRICRSYKARSYKQTKAAREERWDLKFLRRRVWSLDLSSGMYCRVK
jgi:hypothetical protein